MTVRARSEVARTIFLGTGAFGVPIVSALADHPSVDLVAVVSAPQRAGSRGRPTDPPVAQWAEERRVPLLRPARLRAPESIAEIARLSPDLIVLADYGQIVPTAVLELPRHGALNLHPSLLPLHRGAAPIAAAILAGDTETGVTLMEMDADLDGGPIVAQWKTRLAGIETAPELEETLADQAARLLRTTLEHWLAGEIRPVPQDEARASFTRPLRREDGRLDPRKPAPELERQVRAYQPWPGSFVDTSVGRVVVWRAHPVDDPPAEAKLGLLVQAPDGGIRIATGQGLLELDEVQPAGGRRMSGAELLRGRPGVIGESVLNEGGAP